MLRQRVRNASLMHDLSWEKKGDLSGATLPYLLTEVSLKADLATSILAPEAQAPSPHIASLREPNRNRQHLPNPLSKAIPNARGNMQKFL